MIAYSTWGIMVLIIGGFIQVAHVVMNNSLLGSEYLSLNERYDAVNKLRKESWYSKPLTYSLLLISIVLWPITSAFFIYLLSYNSNIFFWLRDRALRDIESLEKKYNTRNINP